MKKKCTKCNSLYENINFCPLCGERLIDDFRNSIDEKVNRIDEKVKAFSDKSGKIVSSINNELATSETVNVAKKAGKALIDAIFITFGVMGALALIFQIIASMFANQPSVLSQVLRPSPNVEYANDIYNYSWDIQFGILFPMIILPCIAIILAGFKRPVFFIALLLLLLLK